MRRRFLIAGIAVAVLLLAGLGVSISLVRSVRSGVRARLRRPRIAPALSLALERSATP